MVWPSTDGPRRARKARGHDDDRRGNDLDDGAGAGKRGRHGIRGGDRLIAQGLEGGGEGPLAARERAVGRQGRSPSLLVKWTVPV